MKSADRIQHRLSRRERQIMDVLFQKGRATAGEILAAMPDPPSNSAVRAHLRTLEDKGHVRHEAADLRYVYMPAISPGVARTGALRHMMETFFGGSPSRVMAALINGDAAKLTPEELDRLSEMIEKARKDGL